MSTIDLGVFQGYSFVECTSSSMVSPNIMIGPRSASSVFVVRLRVLKYWIVQARSSTDNVLCSLKQRDVRQQIAQLFPAAAMVECLKYRSPRNVVGQFD